MMHDESFTSLILTLKAGESLLWDGDIHGDLGLNCDLLIDFITITGPVGSDFVL